MKTFLIATRNAHKTGEIRSILGGDFEYLTLADFPGAPGVIEDAATFAGNASKKSVALARWLPTAGSAVFTVPCRSQAQGVIESPLAPTVKRPEGRAPEGGSDEWWVLADDSGLEVDALQGAPGVYSARFAAVDPFKDGNTPDGDNNAKLLRLLQGVPAEQRTARFRCVLALTPVTAEFQASAPPAGCPGEAARTELFDGTCEGRIDFGPRGQGGFGYDPLFIPNGFEQSFAELGAAVKDRISHRAQALGKLKGWLGAGEKRKA